jgi:hypothetical protein
MLSQALAPEEERRMGEPMRKILTKLFCSVVGHERRERDNAAHRFRKTCGVSYDALKMEKTIASEGRFDHL